MSTERATRRRRREQQQDASPSAATAASAELAVVVDALPAGEEQVIESIVPPTTKPKEKTPRKKRETGVTLRHLAEAAKLLGAQSSAGARAFLQQHYPRDEHKELALTLMQLAAKRVRAENRKRVLLRDVELVQDLLQEIHKIYEAMQAKKASGAG